jgi:hypothetical protein
MKIVAVAKKAISSHVNASPAYREKGKYSYKKNDTRTRAILLNYGDEARVIPYAIRYFRIEESIMVPFLHFISEFLYSSAFAGGRSPFLPPPPPSISGSAEDTLSL